MNATTTLLPAIREVLDMRIMSKRTWGNLLETLGEDTLANMLRAIEAGGTQATRMRTGLANAVACSSARAEYVLGQAGIHASPRQLMKAAKASSELMESIRRLSHGKHRQDDVARVREELGPVLNPPVPGDGDLQPVATEPTTLTTFTVLDQRAPLPVLRITSPGAAACVDATEVEALMLVAVLRGHLAVVEVGAKRSRITFVLSRASDRVDMQWHRQGRRACSSRCDLNGTAPLLDLLAQSLLKAPADAHRLSELDSQVAALVAGLHTTKA
jgi:hypothetical protein